MRLRTPPAGNGALNGIPVTAASAVTWKYCRVGKNERAKIVMTDAEIAEFIDHSRTATLATVLPGGRPHLVAMWYAVLDGEIWFETKAKSQKAVNLRRDPTVTVMIEDGLTYDTLRGVSIDGRAEIVEDPEVRVVPIRMRSWDHRKLGMLAVPVGGSTAKYLD
jgi:PPOX class probable F420-dependent enzyme